MFRLILISFWMFLASTPTFAQTSSATLPPAPAEASSSSVSLPDTGVSASNESGESRSRLREILGNRKFEENHEITDAKLKAEEGSLSRYSLKFNLSYYGPTLSDFGAADQPNPDGSIGTYETAIGGSMSGRYRIDPATTVSMGTGLKAVHPFHGMERFDTNNPYLSYDMSSRFGGLQMRNSPGISLITLPAYTKVGEYASINWDNSLVYNLGMSRFAVGLDTSFSYFFYNRGYEPADKKSARDNLSVIPNLKYNFSDKLNVNTSAALLWWNPRMRADQWAMWNRTISQRIGIGYALKRDIYFAPYLNFYPTRLAWAGTTLNFSTIFSLL